TSDNYWVKQLWELGVLGAVWYTAFLVVAARAAIAAFRRAPALVGAAMPLAVVGLLAQQAAAAWFTNTLDPSPYNLIFWLLLGLIRTPAAAVTPEAHPGA